MTSIAQMRKLRHREFMDKSMASQPVNSGVRMQSQQSGFRHIPSLHSYLLSACSGPGPKQEPGDELVMVPTLGEFTASGVDSEAGRAWKKTHIFSSLQWE